MEKQIYRQWWFWIALLSPTLIMAPILLWPHYGLFSDADQVITFPRYFLDHYEEGLKRILFPFDDGRYNPLFYGLTILIFAINPDSALIFYLAQWTMFVGANTVLAWSIYKVTGKNSWSIFGILLFCSAASIFENFYTLDKIEPRITFFSAILIGSFLNALLREDKLSLEIKKSMGYSMIFYTIQIFFGVCLVFSKENGVFFAISLALCWAIGSILHLWPSHIKRLFFRTALIQGAVFLIFIALFKLLMKGDGRYVIYSIDWSFIQANLTYYLTSSPELLLGLVCALYWFASLIYAPWRISRPNQFAFMVFLSIALWVFFSGMILWRWPLDYYLLPAQWIAAILLPLTIWVWFGNKKSFSAWKMKAGGIIFIAIWLLFLGMRIVSGFFIYQQDALKDQLASTLSLPDWGSQRFVLTFDHPNSAEIGERIKFFSNRLRKPDEILNLYNFWEANPKRVLEFDRFKDSVGLPPSREQLVMAAQATNAPLIWKYGDGLNQWARSMWTGGNLQSGDIILFPYGEGLPKWLHARGLGMYSATFYKPDSIEVEEVNVIREKIGPYSIGWKFFRVIKINPPSGN